MAMTEDELIVHLTKQMAQVVVGHTVDQIVKSVSNLVAGCAVVIEPATPVNVICEIATFAAEIISYNREHGVEPSMVRSVRSQ